LALAARYAVTKAPHIPAIPGLPHLPDLSSVPDRLRDRLRDDLRDKLADRGWLEDEDGAPGDEDGFDLTDANEDRAPLDDGDLDLTDDDESDEDDEVMSRPTTRRTAAAPRRVRTRSRTSPTGTGPQIPMTTRSRTSQRTTRRASPRTKRATWRMADPRRANSLRTKSPRTGICVRTEPDEEEEPEAAGPDDLARDLFADAPVDAARGAAAAASGGSCAART